MRARMLFLSLLSAGARVHVGGVPAKLWCPRAFAERSQARAGIRGAEL